MSSSSSPVSTVVPDRSVLPWAQRAGCLAYLAALVAGTGLVFIGALQGNSTTVKIGLAAALLALALRAALHRSVAGFFEGVEIDSPSESRVSGARADELGGLLTELAKLERARGTPAFDPWACQSVRHEIRALVSTDIVVRRTLGLDGR